MHAFVDWFFFSLKSKFPLVVQTETQTKSKTLFSHPKTGWFIFSQFCSCDSRLLESIQFSIGIGGSCENLYHLVGCLAMRERSTTSKLDHLTHQQSATQRAESFNWFHNTLITIHIKKCVLKMSVLRFLWFNFTECHLFYYLPLVEISVSKPHPIKWILFFLTNEFCA